MEYRNQHRLKDRKIERYAKSLKEMVGDSPFKSDDPVDVADTPNGKVLLLDKKPVASFYDDEIFPTIDGLLKISPTKSYVTVDMGAVRFVYNGADIMAPGIVDADKKIEKGDIVWIKDEQHGKPLAVGEALTEGEEMVSSNKGKVVKTFHHVGDEKYK
ncbi:MAG: DUF1947 domain-containing protein [Thermoplasmatota archaeon]